MNRERWQQVKIALYQALERTGEARAAYIEQVAAADPELKVELQSLVAAHDGSADSFLNIPAAAIDGGLDAASFQADSLLGNYRLLSEIGQGGMGQVWLAEQTSPVHRLVALKLIRAGMYDPKVVQRFQTERQSLAIMDHPAIAKVFDAGSTSQGQPYLVMEYVPGIPITEYCDRKNLTLMDRIALFIQACDGVQHAHQKAIIHRDLKPANIMIVEVDGKALPRIIDFGLAKPSTPPQAGDAPYTQFGQFIGTPGYMSPEQIDPRVKDIDTRTDVYSLGVILYVLLTGFEPFEKKHHERPSFDEWLHQLRTEDAPSLTSKLRMDRDNAVHAAVTRSVHLKQLVGQLHGDLEWITARALERDRDHRYATPSELAADLRRHLNDEPVLARPATSVYKIHKFIRRHRIVAAAAGTVSVLAIAASSAGIIAVRQKHEAEYQTGQALQAQAQLLTQVAAQKLERSDIPDAQGIILEVLTNPKFARVRPDAAITVFEEVRAAESQLAVLSGHQGWVWRATYSPDGARIATASADKTARIWDAVSGAPLLTLSGHSRLVSDVEFSPDSTRIVTASADKTVRIWDARTGSLLTVLRGHEGTVYAAAYSPDGARLVTASADKTARIWDAEAGTLLKVLSGHTAVVNSAAYSPDGSHVVTGSGDNTARIWDVRTARTTTLIANSSEIYSIAYSPDGTRIIGGARDGKARVWLAQTGALINVFEGLGGAVYCAAYSPDGAHIVTASGDKIARILDANTGAVLRKLVGHEDGIYSALYSPDGARVITGSVDRTVRIWDASLGSQLRTLSGHADVVESARFSPDGQRVASASKDKTARIWDANTGVALVTLVGHDNIIESAAYSPDGARVVTGGYGNIARVWDATTGAPLVMLKGHNSALNSVAYSPDGLHIVTASQDKTARTWDALSGAPLLILTGHNDTVFSAAYSPDGQRIVTASADKTARVWSSASGVLLTVLSGHNAAVNTAEYSPDGLHIVTASEDKTARIWPASGGAALRVLVGHDSGLSFAAYSPDSTHIVTASKDKTARIWDAGTATVLAVFIGHSDEVYSASYSPNGDRIVTASADKTARIWDARIASTLETQILWNKAAEFDPLPETERTQFGLPPQASIRQWPTSASECDQSAAAIYDPDRLARGVSQLNIEANAATACAAEAAYPGKTTRTDYQLGRALLAKHDLLGARQQFEAAVSKEYRAAQIDLASFLLDSDAGTADADHARSLFEQAWRNGVPIAAFELGHLYEYGGNGTRPDPARSWKWYELGARAGEPNALARFAQRDEADAVKESSVAAKDALLLRAFGFFAAAVKRAEAESWPDDAWRNWRHRRATLARLLAREGKMQQVAAAYVAAVENGTSSFDLLVRQSLSRPK